MKAYDVNHRLIVYNFAFLCFFYCHHPQFSRKTRKIYNDGADSNIVLSKSPFHFCAIAVPFVLDEAFRYLHCCQAPTYKRCRLVFHLRFISFVFILALKFKASSLE